jgi:subtilisin family serine protease
MKNAVHVILASLLVLAVALALPELPAGFALAEDDRGGAERDDDPGADAAASPREADPEAGHSGRLDDLHEPDEVVAAGLDDAQLAALRSQGFVVMQVRVVAGERLARLSVPRGMTPESAVDRVRRVSPGAVADRNALYRAAAGCAGVACQPARLIDWPDDGCGAAPLLGLVDTAVDRGHATLSGQRVEAVGLRGKGREASGVVHGTALASILVGRSSAGVPGLLPRAQLIAVDAFHRRAGEDRMDSFDFVAALDLLVQRGVRVANLSFAGPPNALAERAVERADREGLLMVAAAGNDGPAAPPRYPAAYPQVIAVTAVGSDLKPYRRAARGAHIAFAAPGVGISTADAGTGRRVSARSGTSMAAPFVAAAVALLQWHEPAAGPDRVRERLRARSGRPRA